MIIFRNSFSEVKNFVKRTNKEHGRYHDEGCGCCASSTSCHYDPKTKLIIMSNVNRYQDSETTRVDVLGRYKGKATLEARRWRW